MSEFYFTKCVEHGVQYPSATECPACKAAKMKNPGNGDEDLKQAFMDGWKAAETQEFMTRSEKRKQRIYKRISADTAYEIYLNQKRIQSECAIVGRGEGA